MKRIEYTKFGGPEVMHIDEFSLPELEDEQVRVKVKASSINEIDWKMRQGYMKLMSGSKFPKGMGKDFSGVVVETKSTQLKIGDEVFGGAPAKDSWAFAEELIANAKDVIKKPKNITFEEAATLPVVGGTAWKVLTAGGKIKQGDKVFINGAYGAMGQVAVQIAKALGASQIVARVSPSDFEAVKAIGATKAISYKEPVPDNYNQTFDIVFDTHGSLELPVQSRIVNKGGVILDVVPSGAKVIRSLVSSKRKIVFGTTKAEVMQELATLAQQKELQISVGKTVTLNEAAEAIAYLEEGNRIKGKTVIAFND